MRKTLIIILVFIAVLTTLFFKDISNYFRNEQPEPETSSEITADAKTEMTDGVSILLEVQPHEDGQLVTPEEMRRAQKTLSERIDSLAGINAIIKIEADNRIEVQIPDINLEHGKEITKRLTQSGKLTIHEAHPLHNQSNSKAYVLAKKVFEREEIVPTYVAYPLNKTDENGVYLRDENGNYFVGHYWLVKRRIGVNGSDIEFAQPSTTQPGTVEVTLTDKGAHDMKLFSTNMKQGEYIISVIDGNIVSAAILNAPSLGKRFVITGQSSKAESEELAMALNSPLENDIKVLQIRNIVDSKMVEEK